MPELAFCVLGRPREAEIDGNGKMMTELENQAWKKNDYDYLIGKREGSSECRCFQIFEE